MPEKEIVVIKNPEIYFDEINRGVFKHNPPIMFEKNYELAEKFSEGREVKFPEEVYFYKITELSYEEEFPRREAFENVISSINSNTFNFVYFLSGNKKGVSIYLGIVDNYKQKNSNDTRNNFDVSEALITSFNGNFLGSKTDKLTKEEIAEEIFNKIRKSKRKSFFYGIPSENEENMGEKDIFQGIDRLINSMRGEIYQFIVVSEYVDKDTIDDVLDKVYEYYNQIALHAEGDYSINLTEGDNWSNTESETSGTSRSKSQSGSTTKGTTDGGSSYSTSKSKTKSSSNSESENKSKSKSKTEGGNRSRGETKNYKRVQKILKEQLDYLDEEYIPRLQLGRAKGMFKTAIYAMSRDNATLDKLEGNIKSIFQGDKTTLVPLREVRLFDNSEKSKKIKEDKISAMISHFQIYHTNAFGNDAAYLLQNIERNGNYCELGTYFTTHEVSLIAGLPISEVPGIQLNEAVDFGVNVPQIEKGFELGNIVQRGIILEYNKVKLNPKILNKHIFISGVTGSGKTTTCQKILLETDYPFLVIEPAKTEYRQLYEYDKSLKIFTVGRNNLSPFMINPLELVRGENLSAHVDMLMATFQAVFPMEASMPYILKEAIINSYEKLGWDLELNENIYSDDPWNAKGIFWPTFSNILSELSNVVNKKGFAAELKQNYIGSLVSRFSDLTIGTRGSIFNVPLSVDFEELIGQNVVIELDELKNEEDKILLMGFILTRINEILKMKYRKNPKSNFKHITLIEEAHRLLSKPEPGEVSKKLGVQTFTDMLAEVRKYGESLIIVDQIPSKLTPEIMKNTNTKIVHKIFADDDKTAIAHSISLNEKQKEFLSKLKVGEAIVFTEDWQKPAWIKIKAGSNLKPTEIDETTIKKIGLEFIKKNAPKFFPFFAELELNEEQIKFLLANNKRYVKKLSKLIDNYKNEKLTLPENGEAKIKEILNEYTQHFDENIVFKFLAEALWELIEIKVIGNESDFLSKRNDAVKTLSGYLTSVYNNLDFEITRIIREFNGYLTK